MALSGVLGLFRGKPIHPVGPQGQMALADHFRELRARLMRSVAAIVVLFFVALSLYPHILDIFTTPYNKARLSLGAGVVTKIILQGAGSGLMLQMKMCGVAALIASSPIWLYQIWAFILPGLHRNERRWTYLFSAIAGPLFLLGVGMGYYVMPTGLKVLIGFTPKGFENLIEFNDFFSFFCRTLLVFGVAFEIPLFVVLLNLVGVLRGRTLAQYRPWIVVGVFVFAAVATPSQDPISMLFLALPMTGLFLVSEVVARSIDRVRGRREAESAISPDEPSPLPGPDES